MPMMNKMLSLEMNWSDVNTQKSLFIYLNHLSGQKFSPTFFKWIDELSSLSFDLVPFSSCCFKSVASPSSLFEAISKTVKTKQKTRNFVCVCIKSYALGFIPFNLESGNIDWCALYLKGPEEEECVSRNYCLLAVLGHWTRIKP